MRQQPLRLEQSLINPPPRANSGPPGLLLVFLLPLLLARIKSGAAQLELAGVTVIPHTQSSEMRYWKEPNPELGARVQLYLRNGSGVPLLLTAALPIRCRGRTPSEWLADGAWTWHDTPSAWPTNDLLLAPGALTVWSFNGAGTNWGAGTGADLSIDWGAGGSEEIPVSLQAPSVWLSAVTFLGTGLGPVPDSVVFHVANRSGAAVRPSACRLWLPSANSRCRELRPQPWLTRLESFPADGVIPPGEKGGARVATGSLPLGYAALEVACAGTSGTLPSLWAHLRVKREVFDLGAGWVASGLGSSNTLHVEPYLKTLRRMHLNAGMHQEVPGYSNTPLFDRYPLKYMNRLQPFQHYDTDAMLPRIHAVEFLGEPQYGGGRPVPPMEVWRALAPYQATRLPTSVTHSEERVWRYYAGLSDYPHFDAYRVSAPAPDAWGRYDRWGGERLRWGAPLETIGEMTRSLRDLNRPMPIACWSQGAHDGWERHGGRSRLSPTPGELRVQACEALAQRITSLYWFNLSLKSLVRFRDLIDPITRVNREIRMMEDLLLEGDAYEQRREPVRGTPSWDLASVMGPQGGLLFVVDLAYRPDPVEKIFRFQPREGAFQFKLPPWMDHPAEVFRFDADGVKQVPFSLANGGVEIRDRLEMAAFYVVAPRPGIQERMQRRHAELIRFEGSFDFDPAGSDADFERLRRLVP